MGSFFDDIKVWIHQQQGDCVFEGSDETEKFFQGPVADALTHMGQLAILRPMADCSIWGENNFRHEFTAGRVAQRQPAPVREFWVHDSLREYAGRGHLFGKKTRPGGRRAPLFETCYGLVIFTFAPEWGLPHFDRSRSLLALACFMC
jgi:hypothetical protein